MGASWDMLEFVVSNFGLLVLEFQGFLYRGYWATS